MLSQAFIDESGGLDHPHLFVGGFVGAVEMWKSFSEAWQRVLDCHKLPALHMVRLRNKKRGGAWYDLDERTKHEVLLELVAVIRDHSPQAFMATVGIEDFRARMPATDPDSAWRYPYTFAVCHLAGSFVGLEEVCQRELGQVEIIFDWMNQFHRSAGWMIETRVRKYVSDHANRLGRIGWAGEHNRGNYVPLQAADMLVWHYRRQSDPSLPPERKVLSNQIVGMLKQATHPRFITVADGGRNLLDTWRFAKWDDKDEPPPEDYSPIL